MLQHFHTIYVSTLKIKDQNTGNKNVTEVEKKPMKEAIVNIIIIKKKSVTSVGFGRKKFDKLTFDFYTHGTYITEIYAHSVTMINIQVIVLLCSICDLGTRVNLRKNQNILLTRSSIYKVFIDRRNFFFI